MSGQLHATAALVEGKKVRSVLNMSSVCSTKSSPKVSEKKKYLSVETCSCSTIICQLIVHWFVIVQYKKYRIKKIVLFPFADRDPIPPIETRFLRSRHDSSDRDAIPPIFHPVACSTQQLSYIMARPNFKRSIVIFYLYLCMATGGTDLFSCYFD
jgi:hypothetical protein